MFIAILAVFAYSSIELLNKLEEKDERKEAAKEGYEIYIA